MQRPLQGSMTVKVLGVLPIPDLQYSKCTAQRDFIKNQGNTGCKNYDDWLCFGHLTPAQDLIGASQPQNKKAEAVRMLTKEGSKSWDPC